MSFYDELAKQHNLKDEKIQFYYLDCLDSPLLFEEIKQIRSKSVLEIGSGHGRITARLLEKAPDRLICIEPAKEAREILMGKFPLLDLRSSWDDISEQFDFIFIVHTLIHIKDKQAFLKMAESYLKPQGKIVLSLVNQQEPLYIELKSGKRVYQELYPNDLNKIRRDIKELSLKIELEEQVKVTKDKIPPFAEPELGKTLTNFLIIKKF